jgi:hypothetical protein
MPYNHTSLRFATAAQLAHQIASANSNRAMRQAVMAVARSAGIGVYTASGGQLFRGDETGPKDLYLYDFEVAALADGIRRGESSSLDFPAQQFARVGLVPPGQGFDGDALAAVLHAWVSAALRTPKLPSAQIPLLIRDLGLAQTPAYDLARPVAGAAVRLDPLQEYLVQAGLLGPILRRASKLAAARPPAGHRARATASDVCTAAEHRIETPQHPTHGWITDEALDQAKDGVRDAVAERLLEILAKDTSWGKALRTAWLDFGKDALGTIQVGEEVLQSIHATILNTSLSYRNQQDPNATYATSYGPAQTQSGDSWPNAAQPPSGTLAPGSPLSFKVQVVMQDEYPPYVYCLALAGLKVPHKGPVADVPIDWWDAPPARLGVHGSLSGTAGVFSTAATTDGEGNSTLTFTPRDEAIPGMGRLISDQGVLYGKPDWATAFGKWMAHIVNFLPEHTFERKWQVFYHDQSGSLNFDSRVEDGANAPATGSETYEVTAKDGFAPGNPYSQSPYSAPLRSASTPNSGDPLPTILWWVKDTGSINQTGTVSCPEPGGYLLTYNYHFSEAMAPGGNGELGATISTPDGLTNGPLITLSMRPPTDSQNGAQSGAPPGGALTAEGCGAPSFLSSGSSYWDYYFSQDHVSEVNESLQDACAADTPATGCPTYYDLSNWTPTSSGYTKTYPPSSTSALRVKDTCTAASGYGESGNAARNIVAQFANPNCVPTTALENTTITLTSPAPAS